MFLARTVNLSIILDEAFLIGNQVEYLLGLLNDKNELGRITGNINRESYIISDETMNYLLLHDSIFHKML